MWECQNKRWLEFSGFSFAALFSSECDGKSSDMLLGKSIVFIWQKHTSSTYINTIFIKWRLAKNICKSFATYLHYGYKSKFARNISDGLPLFYSYFTALVFRKAWNISTAISQEESAVIYICKWALQITYMYENHLHD